MENYESLIPLDLTSNQSLEPSPSHIGGHGKVRPQDPQATYIMAQRLSELTGKPLDYCLKEFGFYIPKDQA